MKAKARNPRKRTSLPGLDVFSPQRYEFRSSESASEQDGDHGHVTGATEALAIRFLKEQAGLVAVEPVAGPRSELLHAFDSPDSGRQFWAQQRRISRFVGETPDCGEPLIDSACRQAQRLEMQPKSQDHGSVQSQSRFGTVPGDELLHCEPVVPPRIW
jgi:hypothetical protein